MPSLHSLPAHDGLSLLILLGSFFLCLLVYLAGRISRSFRQDTLPPVPLFAASRFPGLWDQLYTLLFAAVFAGSTAVGLLFPSLASPSLTWASVASMALMYLPMLIRYFAFVPREAPCPSLPLAAGLTVAGVALIYMASMAVDAMGLSSWLMERTGAPELQDSLRLFQSGTQEKRWIIATMAVVVAPVAEECCFRGFLYNTLKQVSGRPAAILASSLFFAAIHVSLPQLIPLFLFGVVQCWAYDYVRSLWLPIAIHTLFNATSLTLLLLLGPVL